MPPHATPDEMGSNPPGVRMSPARGVQTMNDPRIQPLRSAGGRNAFTMIEVMIVVVLLAITAAVAMPMVADRSDLKLAAAMRSMSGDLQYAQNYAVATRQSVYVKFAVNKYTLCSMSGTTLVPLTHPVDKGAFVVNFNNASTGPRALLGVTMTVPNIGGNSILAFDSVGAPFSFAELSSTKTSLTGRTTVVVACGSQTSSLAIEPYTGEISVP